MKTLRACEGVGGFALNHILTLTIVSAPLMPWHEYEAR